MSVAEKICQSTQFKDVIPTYRERSEISAGIRSYPAACLMLGASLEAALVAAAQLLEDEIDTPSYPCAPHTGAWARPEVESLSLRELVELEARLGWCRDGATSFGGVSLISLMGYGLPAGFDVAESTRWRDSFSRAAEFIERHRWVTEDAYRSCQSYVSRMFGELADHIEGQVETRRDVRWDLSARQLVAVLREQARLLQASGNETASERDDDDLIV